MVEEEGAEEIQEEGGKTEREGGKEGVKEVER